MTAYRKTDSARNWHLVQKLCAPLALLACGLAHAQSAGVPTISAPESVCTNESFEVEWSGPNASGDRITMTIPAAPADDFSISSPTSDGDPATLNAPGQSGVYEVRYAEGARRNILARQGVLVNDCMTSPSQSSSASADTSTSGETDTSTSGETDTSTSGETSPMPGGQGDHAVLVWGWQYDMNHGAPSPYIVEDLCAASDTIGWALETIVNTGESAAIESGYPILPSEAEAIPGAPQREDIREAIREARDGFCNREDPSANLYPFTITYAHCRMLMRTNAHVLDIQLRPATGAGTMSMADLATGEGARLSLRQQLGAAEDVLGKSWISDVSLTSPTDAGEWIGYPITAYNFEYTGSPGTGMGGFMQSAVEVTSSGIVWVSKAVPGIDIVRSFYENLTNEVMRDDGSLSFFEGMIKNLAGMLREGLPLINVQFTDSGLRPDLDPSGAMSMSGDSGMAVYGVRVVDMAPDFCTRPAIPAHFTMTDIDQQVSEALSQMNSPEMQQAMQEYNQAMQNMTPEQRQMMEQMGVGNILDQMTGGGMPGAQPPAANPRASSGSAGSNMPSSKDLQGGSMTETVQKHLQALGYDVGEANGEASMETVIAISTFQSEKGMDVTGEVSPQLLGILSAEVDSRR